MTRDEILNHIVSFFESEFEIENPGLDANLREAYEFDSIDALEMLREIENMLGTELTQDEKKNAMEIRTINDILDYVEGIVKNRAESSK